jgi:hypothetical protein
MSRTQALLIAQGYTVFSGPPSTAPAVFAAYGMPCPPNLFIAEHMLEVGELEGLYWQGCKQLTQPFGTGKHPLWVAHLAMNSHACCSQCLSLHHQAKTAGITVCITGQGIPLL